MDMELTVPKWVLIALSNIPQMPQKLQPKMSTQAQKFEVFEKKSSLWVSAVRDVSYPTMRVFSVVNL